MFGPDDPNLLKSLDDYARLLREVERDAAAAELEAHAAAIRAQTGDP